MFIRFRIRYNNRIISYGFLLTMYTLAVGLLGQYALINLSQNAIFKLQMSNVTNNSIDSHKIIPFQDCVCHGSSTKLCIHGGDFKIIRLIPLLLFTTLVYFFLNGLTISGNGAYIFVYLYWTFCFICFFTILIILYWKNYYYNEMIIFLIVMSLVESFIYMTSTLPSYTS